MVEWSDDEDGGADGGFGFGRPTADDSDDFESSWDALPPIRDTCSHRPSETSVPDALEEEALALPELLSPSAGLSSVGAAPPSGLGAVALTPLSPAVRSAPAVDAAEAAAAAEAAEAERKRAEAEDTAFRLALEQEAAKRRAIAEAEAKEKARQEELVRQAAARLEAEREELDRQKRAQEENERQQRQREQEAREHARLAEEARAAQAAEEAKAAKERVMEETEARSLDNTSNTSASDYADDGFDDFDDEDIDDGVDDCPQPEPEPEPEPQLSDLPVHSTGWSPDSVAVLPEPEPRWSHSQLIPELEPRRERETAPEPGPNPSPVLAPNSRLSTSGTSVSRGNDNGADGWSKGLPSQVPPFAGDSDATAPSDGVPSHGPMSTLDRLEFEASVAEGASQIANEMGQELVAKVTEAQEALAQAEADALRAASSSGESEAADYSDEDFEDYDDDFEEDVKGHNSEEEEEEVVVAAAAAAAAAAAVAEIAPAPVPSESSSGASKGHSSPIAAIIAPATDPDPTTLVKSLLQNLDAVAEDEVESKPSEIEPTQPQKLKQPALKPAPPAQPKPADAKQLTARVRERHVEVASLKPVPPPAGTGPPSNGAFSKVVHTERDVEQWRKKKNREARRKAREAQRLVKEAQAKEIAKKEAAKAALAAAAARRKQREAKKRAAIREKKRKQKAAQAKAAAELAAAMEAETRAKEEERRRDEEKKLQLRERGRAVITQQRLARKEAAEKKQRLRLERRLAAMEREDAVALVSECADEKIKLNVLAGRVAQLETEIQAEEKEIEQLRLPAIDVPPAQVQSARTPRSKKTHTEARGWATNRTPKEATDPQKKAANDLARSRRAAMKQNDMRRRQNNRDLLHKKQEMQQQRHATQQHAATKLQCTWRGVMVRLNDTRAATLAREQNAAATILETRWRGTSTRRRLQRERRAAEVAAADAVLGLVLRNWFPQRQLRRRRRTRDETERKLQRLANQELGASQIQALYRGHRTRKEQNRGAQERQFLPEQLTAPVPVVLEPVPPASKPKRKKHHRHGVAARGDVETIAAHPVATRAIWL